ncbi:peptide transporter PTR2-A [Xylogone sp. PMI_703]|nr:peptide transporter PTR2-A [Xylogone sp. PMI_703]
MTTEAMLKDENVRRDATEEEIKTLRHVVDSIPRIAWIALMIGAAERFTYYGITAPWQNYMQNLPSLAVPGELGLGQSISTNLYNAFYFFSFLTPLPFAILSDAWLGRYNTLCVSFFPLTTPVVSLYLCGCIVLFVTSLPELVTRPGKIGGLACSMVLIALGSGGVKATISPFIGDQYTQLAPQLIVTNKGERVIADRTLTIQYIYNLFYWLTNIGSLSLIATTYLEKYRGFWAAFLLPLCSFWIGIALMVIWSKEFVKLSPKGNVLLQATKVLAYSAKGGFKLDFAKPGYQLERYGKAVSWSDNFIAEMKCGLLACRVMACFVVFYLCINQISNNLISQAGQMRLDGIPNDTIQALNPIAGVLLGPIIQNILYPTLKNKFKIQFGPIARMTTAFITMAGAMVFAAVVQKLIYNTEPCYEAPLECPASDGGRIPNNISVWLQTPIYFILALSEILGFATLSEYSYSKAPRDMRSLVQALRQLTAGVGSALGMALSPVTTNPKVMYMYIALAVIMAISGPPFWLLFSKYDDVDEELNNPDRVYSMNTSQVANNEDREKQ